MKQKLFILLCCAVLLSGCASRQLEEDLLVIALTVDRDEKRNMTVSVKAPRNAASGDDGENSYLMVEATGPSFSDALTMLNAATPRPLNFSQVREVIIGESAAMQDEFARLLRQIDALPRFRCSAAVIVCKGEAKAFSKAQKPYLGTRLSRYTETTLSNYAGKGFTPKTTLCCGMRDLGYGFCDPLFILGAVNSFSDTPPNENALDTQAGQLPRKSAEAVEVFGAAATNGICVSGYLSGYEMALLHLIEGHVEALSMRDSGGNALRITAQRPAEIRVDLKRQPVLLSLRVYCEGSYTPGHPPDEENVASRLQAEINAVIAHLQRLRCDGVGFGKVAARQFLTVQEWEQMPWRDAYCQAETDVQVVLRCKES
ncbi:MAG: hypothetical protein IK099_15115 [Clostridia bacterium]|nr:hypothetical protein [Clostridia bacterium]